MCAERRIELLQKIDAIQTALIASCTQDEGDVSTYEPLRTELMAHPEIAPLLPEFVKRYRNVGQFWPFIKKSFVTYAERRTFIWDAFAPSVNYAERLASTPADQRITAMLGQLNAEHVRSIWAKALDRVDTDADGAITAARSLLESVCKLILDDAGVKYAGDAALPQLYSTVAKQLNLAPSQHSEAIFRQILGGCQAVVEGLGAVRNRVGDAHGQGRVRAKPATRHAELAVNLAGSMATFLVSTWKSTQKAAE